MQMLIWSLVYLLVILALAVLRDHLDSRAKKNKPHRYPEDRRSRRTRTGRTA